MDDSDDEERRCFRQDADGHWYLIWEEMADTFQELEEAMSNAEEESEEFYTYFGSFEKEFQKYRCDCPSGFTFLNPIRT